MTDAWCEAPQVRMHGRSVGLAAPSMKQRMCGNGPLVVCDERLAMDTEFLIALATLLLAVVATAVTCTVIVVRQIGAVRSDLCARMDRMDARLDRMDARLEARMDRLSARVDRLADAVSALRGAHVTGALGGWVMREEPESQVEAGAPETSS